MMTMGGPEAMLFLAFLLGLAPVGGDLASFLDEEAFFRQEKIERKAEALIPRLAGRSTEGIERHLQNLGSENYGVREMARRSILEMGPEAIPRLKPLLESPDAGVKALAADLQSELEKKGKSDSLTRLLAIRALGNLKAAGALPALQGLARDGDPFVREYAERAAAQIEGKAAPAFEKPMTGEGLRSLASILPADTGVLAAWSFKAPEAGKSPLDLLLGAMGAADGAADDRPAEEAPDMAAMGREARNQANLGIAALVREVGNLRLDGAVLGVSKDVGDKAGWVAILVRGTFDRTKIAEALKARAGARAEARGDREVIAWEYGWRKDGAGEMAFLDDRTAAFGFRLKVVKSPMDGILARKEGAPDGLAANARIWGRLSKADLGGGLWATADLLDEIRKDLPKPGEHELAQALTGIDFATLSAAGEKGERLRLALAFREEKQAKAVADFCKKEIEKAAKQVEGEPMLPKPMSERIRKFLAGIEIKAEGASASAEAGRDALTSMPMMWMLMASGVRSHPSVDYGPDNPPPMQRMGP